jgi:transposase-like protein
MMALEIAVVAYQACRAICDFLGYFQLLSTFSPPLGPAGAVMDDLKTFCCQNPDCPDYGQRGRDNLRVCFRNGPNKERRVLACRTCQKRFSERQGTPLYRCKLSEEKALSVLQHLQESCGVRQTGRLVGVHRNTVTRLALVAGTHAHQVHDDLVAFSPSDPGSPVR